MGEKMLPWGFFKEEDHDHKSQMQSTPQYKLLAKMLPIWFPFKGGGNEGLLEYNMEVVQ